MRLSRAAEYATQAVCQLAKDNFGTCVPSHKLAAAGDMPEKFLLEILRRLVNAGILTSMRGPEGGYRLARGADEISVLDIIEAADGPLRDLRSRNGDREDYRRIAAESVFSTVTEEVRACFQSITVLDLLESAGVSVALAEGAWVHDGDWVI